MSGRVERTAGTRADYSDYLADFPWCGYMIDMKNLTISVDYTRYKDKGELPSAAFDEFKQRSSPSNPDIENSLTVDRGRKPGAAFMGKMLL